MKRLPAPARPVAQPTEVWSPSMGGVAPTPRGPYRSVHAPWNYEVRDGRLRPYRKNPDACGHITKRYHATSQLWTCAECGTRL